MAVLYELDKIGKTSQAAGMGRSVDELAADERADVEELSSWLKGQRRRSPVKWAELATIAFEVTFAAPKAEAKLAKALMRGVSVRQQMAAAEGGSYSAEEAARQLGTSKQSVINLYHAGKVLAWRTEKQGALRFPVWQFDEDRRLPGLEAVLGALSAGDVLDDWGKIGFFLQNQEALEDRRPLDLLREKRLDLVMKAAHGYVS
jgi:hypothetical protein